MWRDILRIQNKLLTAKKISKLISKKWEDISDLLKVVPKVDTAKHEVVLKQQLVHGVDKFQITGLRIA